jgi:hypothetical protein
MGQQGSGRERGMSRDEGLRGNRAQTSGPPERDADMQTEIEDELLRSGRSHIVPREGLPGAHEERRAGLTPDWESSHKEPVGRGSDVAPTRKAELREAERHRMEREVGHVAAGLQEGGLRQQSSQFATREALDGIAAEADDTIADRHLTAEGEPPAWSQRAGHWLWQHRTAVAAGTGAAAVALGCFSLLRRSR